MPLNGKKESLSLFGGLDCLNRAVVGNCGCDESGRDCLYRLMVEGVGLDLALADDLVKEAALLDLCGAKIYGAALLLTVSVDVLIKAAAEGDVEDLLAAADAEDGAVVLFQYLRERKLEIVAQRSGLNVVKGDLLAVMLGVNVIAARKSTPSQNSRNFSASSFPPVWGINTGIPPASRTASK